MHPRDYFEAESTSLYNLFIDGNFQFKVPDNQRHFAWGKPQIEQLWNDLKETVENSFDDNYLMLPDAHIDPHFFGAIYLTMDQHHNKQNISDGQQRLTSCTILLKLFLQYAQPLEQSKLNGISRRITDCVERSKYGEPYEPRLELDQSINDFFREFILLPDNDSDRQHYLDISSPSYKESYNRIIECYTFLKEECDKEFSDELLQENADRYSNKLLAYLRSLQDLFIVLRIKVRKENTMYVIFETLNQRGLDLSESDLIKNLFFKYNRASGAFIKEKWDSISENIESEDLTSYIRFHHNSNNDYIVNPKNLFKRINLLLESNSNHSGYLNNLESESKWFGFITSKGTAFWDDETHNSLINILNKLSISHSLPLLLAAAVKYGNDKPTFKQISKAIEAFCFRFFTIGSNKVEDLERQINELSLGLRNGDTADVCIQKMQRKSTDAVFKDDFAKAMIKSNDLAFYILYQMEKRKGMASGVIPYGHSANQHVEHIMPKKPSNNWPGLSDDPLYSKYVYRLGNLLVLERDINQKIKNKDYNYKVSNTDNKDYNHSALYYPKKVATDYTTWDFKKIDERQIEMANEALTVWAIQ